MVEIIGEDPKVVKKKTCKNCGAKLQYLPSEVKSGIAGYYDGSTEHYEYIVCPRCKDRVEL